MWLYLDHKLNLILIEQVSIKKHKNWLFAAIGILEPKI